MRIFNVAILFSNGLSETYQLEAEHAKQVFNHAINRTYYQGEPIQITVIEPK